MRLSIYTCVKDGLFYDYHLVDMLRHHLPLADEIIVNDGYSTDGTYERIKDLDPKVKVFRSDWGKPNGSVDWIARFKNEARRRCTGDWCIGLDCDEFIPEWEFAPLRRHLEETSETLVPTRMMNFYGNYKVYHAEPDKVRWPSWKMNVHRNRSDVEVWDDGSHVRLQSETPSFTGPPRGDFTVHHFGFVRKPARLRQKWNLLTSLYSGKPRWLPLPSFLFNWMPHDWKDPQFMGDLQVYEGPYVRAVADNPDEFVRDGLALYHHLKAAAVEVRV